MKLQRGSGDQHHHEVKVSKLISSLLYYTFWDLLVRVYRSIAGQVAFNDNPVQLTFNIFVSLFFCTKDKDPVNLYVPPRRQRQEQSVDGFPSTGILPAFKMFFVLSWFPSRVIYWVMSSPHDCLILLPGLLVGLSPKLSLWHSLQNFNMWETLQVSLYNDILHSWTKELSRLLFIDTEMLPGYFGKWRNWSSGQFIVCHHLYKKRGVTKWTFKCSLICIKKPCVWEA